MQESQNKYYLALNMVPGLGTVLISRLLKSFSSPKAVFDCSIEQLSQVTGLRRQVAEEIKKILDSKKFDQELKEVKNLGIQVICLGDKEYPVLLKEIYDPPAVLYVKGDISILNKLSIAVVGCRQASFYGLQQAERISRELSLRGLCVVSGLARGIDTAAHKGTLSAGGATVAVLGSGLKRIYPPENQELFETISKCGAIVSEFPLETAPHKGNFPRRNRIISGLSVGVVVVEAAKSSGSLITANLALSQNRDVFAVPGAANSANSKGTNKLIKEGAKLVENADDVIDELNIDECFLKSKTEESQLLEKPAGINCSDDAKRLFQFLSTEPIHIDVLVKNSRLTAGSVYKNLLELQLKGLVREIEGKRFVRRREDNNGT